LDQIAFKPGIEIKRSLIHSLYGGNQQSGISFPQNAPYIFIFTGAAGTQHGYKDQWENDEIFSYTGEGQLDDMQFNRGNLKLKDHISDGRRVFLFKQTRKAYVELVSELEFFDYDFFEAPDRNGKNRKAIKFFFRRAGQALSYAHSVNAFITQSHEQLSIYVNLPNITERSGLITSRVGQGAYRKSILHRWKFKCAVTDFNKPEILIASHILAWRHANDEQRLDVHNGILLSPTYDALFDLNLISFENNGKIILSDTLTGTNYKNIGVSGQEKIKNLSIENHDYLDRHRNWIRMKSGQ